MLRHLSRLGVMALCLLPFGASAQAQEKSNDAISPAKLELIKELISVTDVANTAKLTMSQSMEAMTVSLSGLFTKSLPDDLNGQNLSPEQLAQAKKGLAAFFAREMKANSEYMVKTIDFDKLVETVYVPLYDKYYNEQELRDLIVFYKTPTGQKVVIVEPLLAGDSTARTAQFLMPTLQQRMKDVQDQMQKDIQKYIDEFKRLENLTPPPPPPPPAPPSSH